MSFARIKKGKIVEAWNVWDAAGMQNQLGFTILPPAAG
jgi:predicted ester cyclase